MANLKVLKLRIRSVKSTQKITKAMKMVAASKLKRAQERAEQSRPYTEKMERVLSTLAAKADAHNAPQLLTGRRTEGGEVVNNTHMIVLATADRGLCGGFNGSLVKAARHRANELTAQGKKVVILTIGKKGLDLLKHTHGSLIIDKVETQGKKQLSFDDAKEVADKVIAHFQSGHMDSCSLIYNKFISPLVQQVTTQSLIPLEIPTRNANENTAKDTMNAVYEFEPDEQTILEELLPRNIAVQIYRGLLENAASEQGARMTAMDNATRNAGDMIKDLTLVYNRTRQAVITKELIEIISGAEAV